MATELEKQQDAGTTAYALDDFSALMKQTFRPRTDVAEREVERGITALVAEALVDQSVVSEDVLDMIDKMLAGIDGKLSAQINEILHNEDFQKLESSWRGLAYTVNGSETDATLQINVLNVSKAELNSELIQYQQTKWDKSPLFRKIYQAEYDKLGGHPYGCIIGDYQFDHSTSDVRLLRDMGKISAASHAPFIAAAAPTLLKQDSWNTLEEPDDISTIFTGSEYAGWNSMRESENSRYLGLTLPRMMGREPYGEKGTRVDEFNFEEDTDGHEGQKYSWINAAHGMAVNINRAHKEYGWTVKIRGVQSGGEVINLPQHHFDLGNGSTDMKCPTEIAISGRREGELSAAGLISLVHRKNTDKAAFIGAQSLYKPKKYQSTDATSSDNLSSRLPYIFAVSRFSHYLKCMVRDQVGSNREREQIERELQDWISQYVHINPSRASEADKARYPLAGAKVEVVSDEENPGYYMGKFFLRPHFQMEGMDIGMSLVSRLPASRG